MTRNLREVWRALRLGLVLLPWLSLCLWAGAQKVGR